MKIQFPLKSFLLFTLVSILIGCGSGGGGSAPSITLQLTPYQICMNKISDDIKNYIQSGTIAPGTITLVNLSGVILESFPETEFGINIDAERGDFGFSRNGDSDLAVEQYIAIGNPDHRFGHNYFAQENCTEYSTVNASDSLLDTDPTATRARAYWENYFTMITPGVVINLQLGIAIDGKFSFIVRLVNGSVTHAVIGYKINTSLIGFYSE